MEEKYKCFCDKISDNDYNEYDIEGACGLLNQQDEEIKQLKQSQKELAISELEKVKTKFNGERPIDELASEVGIELGYTTMQINNFVNNQIKSLKG